jgi:hypothetical protein
MAKSDVDALIIVADYCELTTPPERRSCKKLDDTVIGAIQILVLIDKYVVVLLKYRRIRTSR